MKHYSEYKKEVKDIQNISNTLRSLEKISATQIKIIKNKIANLDFYTSEILVLLQRLSLFYQDRKNFLLQQKKDGDKVLLVVMGEKGLVGSLWQKISDQVKMHQKKYHQILVIGKKGWEKLADEKITAQLFDAFTEEKEITENINFCFQKVLELFQQKKVQKIDILFADSKSLVQQEIKLVNFLPFNFFITTDQQENFGFPIFNSPKKIIFEELLKKYVHNYFSKIILTAKLSENSSKTLEMEHAKEKSKLLIKKIKNTYKKEIRKKINQAQLESLAVKNNSI